MVRVWAEEMCQNNAWVESIGGDPQEHQHQPVGIEFPELPGSDCVHKFHHGPVVGYSNTWDMLARAVRARDIEILYETPGKELIQHGVTREILGVRAERDGKPCYIAASRGGGLDLRGLREQPGDDPQLPAGLAVLLYLGLARITKATASPWRWPSAPISGT